MAKRVGSGRATSATATFMQDPSSRSMSTAQSDGKGGGLADVARSLGSPSLRPTTIAAWLRAEARESARYDDWMRLFGVMALFYLLLLATQNMSRDPAAERDVRNALRRIELPSESRESTGGGFLPPAAQSAGPDELQNLGEAMGWIVHAANVGFIGIPDLGEHATWALNSSDVSSPAHLGGNDALVPLGIAVGRLSTTPDDVSESRGFEDMLNVQAVSIESADSIAVGANVFLSSILRSSDSAEFDPATDVVCAALHTALGDVLRGAIDAVSEAPCASLMMWSWEDPESVRAGFNAVRTGSWVSSSTIQIFLSAFVLVPLKQRVVQAVFTWTKTAAGDVQFGEVSVSASVAKWDPVVTYGIWVFALLVLAAAIARGYFTVQEFLVTTRVKLSRRRPPVATLSRCKRLGYVCATYVFGAFTNIELIAIWAVIGFVGHFIAYEVLVSNALQDSIEWAQALPDGTVGTQFFRTLYSEDEDGHVPGKPFARAAVEIEDRAEFHSRAIVSAALVLAAVLRRFPRSSPLSLLTTILRDSMRDVFPLAVVLVSILLTYAYLGLILFRDNNEEWFGTYGLSVASCFMMAYGEGPSLTDLYNSVQRAPLVYQAVEVRPVVFMWFVSYIVVVAWLILNTWVAIAIEAYASFRLTLEANHTTDLVGSVYDGMTSRFYLLVNECTRKVLRKEPSVDSLWSTDRYRFEALDRALRRHEERVLESKKSEVDGTGPAAAADDSEGLVWARDLARDMWQTELLAHGGPDMRLTKRQVKSWVYGLFARALAAAELAPVRNPSGTELAESAGALAWDDAVTPLNRHDTSALDGSDTDEFELSMTTNGRGADSRRLPKRRTGTDQDFVDVSTVDVAALGRGEGNRTRLKPLLFGSSALIDAAAEGLRPNESLGGRALNHLLAAKTPRGHVEASPAMEDLVAPGQAASSSPRKFGFHEAAVAATMAVHAREMAALRKQMMEFASTSGVGPTPKHANSGLGGAGGGRATWDMMPTADITPPPMELPARPTHQSSTGHDSVADPADDDANDEVADAGGDDGESRTSAPEL